MRIKIVTDSTSDLPPEICRDLDITVVPINIHFGDKVYQDGVDLSNEGFYDLLESEPIFPQTAAKSPGTFAEVYRHLAHQADVILSIHISPSLSGTFEAARLGSEDAPIPVELIDSGSASMGLGLLTIIAARMVAEGRSVDEIKQELAQAIPNTVAYGFFDTMRYLQRGGRIGKAQAFIGSLLRIKPILAIQHGEVLPIRRTRTRNKGIDALCDLTFAQGIPRELSVMQSTRATDADQLELRLANQFPIENIIRAKIGPAIGTHVGPHAVGVSIIYPGK